MFKILARLMLILLAAGMIAGGLTLLVNSGAGQTLLTNISGGRFNGRTRFAGDNGGLFSSRAVTTGFQRDLGNREFRGRLAQQGALLDMAAKLGLIGLITILVGMLRRMNASIYRRRAASAD
jgi:hypothetical protein